MEYIPSRSLAQPVEKRARSRLRRRGRSAARSRQLWPGPTARAWDLFAPAGARGQGHLAGETADHGPAEPSGAAIEIASAFTWGRGVEVADGEVHRVGGRAQREGVSAAAGAGSRLSRKARAASRARAASPGLSPFTTRAPAGAAVRVVSMSVMRCHSTLGRLYRQASALARRGRDPTRHRTLPGAFEAEISARAR